MAKIRVLWCLAMLFVAAYAAHAQGAVSYAFLEVVDRSNKPVAGAKVEVAGSCVGSPQTTDESGHLPKGFPIGYGDCNTHDFSISKPGFYPFRDVGLFHFGRVSSPFGELYGTRSMEVRNLRVELIAMPGGKDAGKAFDEVQRRRELFWAITDRDAPRVTNLLASGVDPDTTTDDLGGVPGPPGVPAVMYAAAAGGAATLDAFLKAGIGLHDPSYRNLLLVYLGNYPMIYRSNVPPETDSDKAELKLYREVFAKLIAGGVDARAAGPGGETALMLAAANGDAPLVERLLALDPTVDRADDQGRTALVYATTRYGSAPTKPEIVRLLLSKGANPNVLADCTSPLMAAVAYDQPTLVKQLLAARADPNLACPSERNVLRTLVETSRFEFTDHDRENLALLFASGLRPDLADELGTTNLMVAVREGNVEVVSELLKRGATVDARNTMGGDGSYAGDDLGLRKTQPRDREDAAQGRSRPKRQDGSRVRLGADGGRQERPKRSGCGRVVAACS